MSSSKGDARYTCAYDAYGDDAYGDDAADDARGVPPHMRRMRGEWCRGYHEEVEHLFEQYLQCGRALFGEAFHQLGTVRELSLIHI